MLFTFVVGNGEIIGFESRFYLFALEMWRHGPSWFATTYYQPYPDYPATAIFFIYLFSKFLGELTKFTAIFPSALASAMTLTITYLIGVKRSQSWGLSAVCFLLLMNTFVTEGRTISLDQYITCITALCFYLVLLRKFYILFPLFILGFAIRGPIGFIIPASVICLFYLLDKNYKQLLLLSIISSLLFILCISILLGLAYHVGGEPFMRDVLHMQVLGRMQGARPLAWYFYWIESIGAYAITYPVAILVLIGIKNAELNNQKFLKKLIGWVLIILIGLSIPSDKKVRYILAFSPALALLCGYIFTVDRENRYFYVLQRALYVFCIYFPLVCLVLLFLLNKSHQELKIDYTNSIYFLIIMQVIQLILHYKIKYKELSVLFTASFSVIAVFIMLVEPINLQLNQTKQFVNKTEALRMQEQAQLIFYHEGRDGLVIKYLVNMSHEEYPLFIDEPKNLLEYDQTTFFIASDENFQKIPPDIAKQMQVFLHGNIGREPFVVFKTIKV